jgi:hypothetical protein
MRNDKGFADLRLWSSGLRDRTGWIDRVAQKRSGSRVEDVRTDIGLSADALSDPPKRIAMIDRVADVEVEGRGDLKFKDLRFERGTDRGGFGQL